MARPSRWPFEVVRRHEAGAWHERARFTCVRCGGHAEFPIPYGPKSINPEHIAKRAREAGWRADHNSPRAECPRCQEARRQPGERPTKTTAEIIPMTKAATAPVQPTPLTNEQRLSIRALLEKHFDEVGGRYLDGYSDQRIAQEVDVPRIHVERIRDAAYGPIRVTPEVEAAENAILSLEGKLADLTAKLAGLQNEAASVKAAVDKARAALRAA